MLFTLGLAARRAMRRHQGMPEPRPTRLPLWRLLGGEVVWAARQLLAQPLVLVALVGGAVATLAVLGTNAPGPVAELPVRIIVSVGVGWLLAATVRGLRYRGTSRGTSGATASARPLTAAAELASVVVVLTLVVWLLTWLVTGLT